MRSLIAVTASVALLAAQVPSVPAFAQSAPPAPQTASQVSVFAVAFKAFPSGGDPLSMRIADLITANPKLAPELVVYMRNNAQSLSRAQKVAAEHGLAAAADRLGVKARDVCPRNVPRDQCCPDGTWRFERGADGRLYDVGCADPWFIIASIIAVAAITCVAACRNNPGAQVVFIPTGSPH
jgi:hypothetical protein